MKDVKKCMDVLNEYDNAYDMLRQFAVISESLDKDELACVMWGVHARMCDEFEDELWHEYREVCKRTDE